MQHSQTYPSNNSIIKAVTNAEQQEINRFLNRDIFLIRHLDWFIISDWIGHQPFLVEKHNDHIQAVLLAVPEVREAAWIRLFGVKQSIEIFDAWTRLLIPAMHVLEASGIYQLAALGLTEWFIQLLIQSGFEHGNDITILELKGNSNESTPLPAHFEIRTMVAEDLADVFHIDQMAFTPLWQNSLAGLSNAFRQPGVSTVAVSHGKVVAYQISTGIGIHGHLARLAVHPDHQGQNLASVLVLDVINRFKRTGIERITVNTQTDNKPSLTIYQKFGFKSTGEFIPVYQRPV